MSLIPVDPVVNATDTVTLTCTVDDCLYINFNFTWFFEEEAVGSSVVVTSVNQSTSIASISSISGSDFGMYTCQVTNRAGSVNVTTSVREMGKLQYKYVVNKYIVFQGII